MTEFFKDFSFAGKEERLRTFVSSLAQRSPHCRLDESGFHFSGPLLSFFFSRNALVEMLSRPWTSKQEERTLLCNPSLESGEAAQRWNTAKSSLSALLDALNPGHENACREVATRQGDKRRMRMQGPGESFLDWHGKAVELVRRMEDGVASIPYFPHSLFLRNTRLASAEFKQAMRGSTGQTLGDAVHAFTKERERTLLTLLDAQSDLSEIPLPRRLAELLVPVALSPHRNDWLSPFVYDAGRVHMAATLSMRSLAMSYTWWRSLFGPQTDTILARMQEAMGSLEACASHIRKISMEDFLFDSCTAALVENPLLLALASGLLDVTFSGGKPLFLVGLDATGAHFSKRLLDRFPYEAAAGSTGASDEAEGAEQDATDEDDANRKGNGDANETDVMDFSRLTPASLARALWGMRS